MDSLSVDIKCKDVYLERNYDILSTYLGVPMHWLWGEHSCFESGMSDCAKHQTPPPQ